MNGMFDLPSEGFSLSKLLGNPNVINLMAGVGRGLAGPSTPGYTSIGDILGGATQDMVRATQFQKAAKGREKSRGLQQQVLEAFLEMLKRNPGSILTDPSNPLSKLTSDNAGKTTLTIDEGPDSGLATEKDKTLSRDAMPGPYVNPTQSPVDLYGSNRPGSKFGGMGFLSGLFGGA